jgi:hypothetical protein
MSVVAPAFSTPAPQARVEPEIEVSAERRLMAHSYYRHVKSRV